jgi:N-hydroxyarylamine O-acetyltransferase
VELHLDAYLARVGCARPPAATADGLAALHEAHCAAVPFENLDILLGRPIRLDLPSLQAKIVGGRRGGYCFEQNTLFQAALAALGFAVTPLAARVRTGSPPAPRARTHMVLLVTAGDERYLADVGFGGGGLVRPLPLRDGASAGAGALAHRVLREGEGYRLQGRSPEGWSDLYAFDLVPQLPADYELASWYTSTHPQSPFVQTLTAQRSWPERRAILRNRELVVHGADGIAETTLVRDPEHLLEVLASVFGLEFPAGTRFSQPPF